MKIKHLILRSIASFVAVMPPTLAALDVDLVFVGDAGGSAYVGASQGLAEANLQGRFLGQTYFLDTNSVDELLANGTDALAILADVPVGDLERLSAALPGIAVYNLTSDDDRLRAACLENLLHVIPSARMKADGAAQWRTQNPGATVRAGAWHRDFRKFAARELNNRFRKAHGAPMDDEAWAGWAAVKMLSDTVAREGIEDQAALLDYMRDRLRFDGQKGRELSFRPTGQLSQLLLISDAEGTLLGEVPLRGKPLDSLGLSDCPK
jgi:hypothetical protein